MGKTKKKKEDRLKVLIREIGQRFGDINVSGMLQIPQRPICGSNVIQLWMMRTHIR